MLSQSKVLFTLYISPQVEAVTEEGKKPYKSNKQVKTDVTFESFLDLMHGDLQGLYYCNSFSFMMSNLFC